MTWMLVSRVSGMVCNSFHRFHCVMSSAWPGQVWSFWGHYSISVLGRCMYPVSFTVLTDHMLACTAVWGQQCRGRSRDFGTKHHMFHAYSHSVLSHVCFVTSNNTQCFWQDCNWRISRLVADSNTHVFRFSATNGTIPTSNTRCYAAL